MAERYSPEVEKTKAALVETYLRLKACSDNIQRLNLLDDLDGVERAAGIRETLLERIEYLKARLQTEISLNAKNIDAEAQKIAAGTHYLTPNYERMF